MYTNNQEEEMRYFVILAVVGILAACAPQTVMLQHPDTGKTVQCGPFETLLEESQCLNEYQSKGYERSFDTHSSEGYKLADPSEPLIRIGN